MPSARGTRCGSPKLLGEHVVPRKSLGDDRTAQALTLEINFGDEIDLALLADAEAGLLARELDLPGAQDDLGGCGEKNRIRQEVDTLEAGRA
jgi:hypothetical protein